MLNEFKSILKLSLPIAFIYLAGMLMNIVDTMFVGHLGAAQLAACTLGHSIFAVAFVFSIGVLSSLDFFISRDVGANKKKDCIEWLENGVIISIILGLLFIFVLHFSKPVFNIFSLDSKMTDDALEFLKLMCISLVPFLMFLVFRQFLQAHSVVMPVVGILILANILNALLNWILVFGNLGFQSMGIRGSAIATILARVFMFVGVLVVFLIWKKDHYKEKISFKISKHRMSEIIKVGLPAGLQMLLEVGVFSTSTLLAGKFGPVILSSHQIVLQIASFTFMVPLGISSAATVLIGNAVGENKIKKAVQNGWRCFQIGSVINLFSSIVLLLFSKQLISTFTKDQMVIELAQKLILIAAFFQLSDAIQVIGAGVMRGFGITKSVFVMNLIGHWVVGLPIGIYLAFYRGTQVWGIWIGLCAGLIFVAGSLLVLFRKHSLKIS